MSVGDHPNLVKKKRGICAAISDRLKNVHLHWSAVHKRRLEDVRVLRCHRDSKKNVQTLQCLIDTFTSGSMERIKRSSIRLMDLIGQTDSDGYNSDICCTVVNYSPHRQLQ